MNLTDLVTTRTPLDIQSLKAILSPMPIYEYICTDCGKEFEVIQKASEAPLTQCEACGGTLEKKLSLTSFQLKGSGWYKDGYQQSSGAKKESKTVEKTQSAKKPDASAKKSST